jgi:hypothetical protein
MKNSLVLFFLLISLFSCSSTPKKIASVDLKRVDPKCIPLAKIITENRDGVEALALRDAENKVRDLGGDTLAIEETVRNGKEVKFGGVAFRCKTEE